MTRCCCACRFPAIQAGKVVWDEIRKTDPKYQQTIKLFAMLEKNDLAGLQALLTREKNSTDGTSSSLLLLVDFEKWSGLHNVPVSWGAFVFGIFVLL